MFSFQLLNLHCRSNRDRVKRLRESISKLERYREALSSKKRQRSDISSERTSGVNIAKMGGQIHRNGHDLLTQRLEDRPKSMGLNKRVRTSVADLRVCVILILLEYLFSFGMHYGRYFM